MANTRTAYRWNVNGCFFKTIEVAEDPDFPGEYTLPTRSTWSVPMDDTETQWPKINTSTLTWELTDLSMAERLAENLITQEEYDTWYAQKDGQFLSVLKNRADSDANNIALISAVAKAGSGITVTRNGDDTVIRDTKNKIGFFFSLYDAGSGYSSNYGPMLPSDFNRIISAFGAADSGSVRVSVNRSDNEVCLYSSSNFTIASLFVLATKIKKRRWFYEC